MLKMDKDKITIIDEQNQRLEFSTDGRHEDYYFTLFSNFEARPGDYYSFIIDNNNPVYGYFKWFLEREIDYANDEMIKTLHPTSYFVIDDNSARIADQNRSVIESEFMKICLLDNKIKIIFSEKYPASIRVNGLGRRDHYPYFIPVIDLFNALQNIHLKSIIKGTGCYQNIMLGNTVSITGDGGNAWGYFGSAYKKLAPSWKLYEYWRDNPGHLSDDDLIDYYIKEYLKHRLLNLDVPELLSVLKEKFGEEIILLCHELPGIEINKETFCHRRVVADYIELESGIIIPEISTDIQGNITALEQRDYKPKLKRLIKELK